MHSKRVLITGISGLIGRETVPFLINRGYEVFGLVHSNAFNDDNVTRVTGNLFDYAGIERLVSQIRPTHLLHFAWKSTGCFNANINFEYISASVNLLRAFAENGGKRAVISGSYVEYGYNNENLNEFDSPISPIYLYGKCKHHLHEIAKTLCKSNNITLTWGRIFSAFGHEHEQRRLTAYVVNNLQHDQEVVIKSGSLLRDYIYSKDVAEAFVRILEKNILGSINICTGKETSIHDFVMKIATQLGKEDLVSFAEQKSEQQPRVVGDNARLVREVGFKPRYSIDTALSDFLGK